MAQGNKQTHAERFRPGETWKTGSTMYSVEKEAFAEWLALAPELRDPPNFTALAAKLEVTVRTLHNWKKEPSVVSKVQQIAGRFVKTEIIPDILNTLAAQATDSSNPRSVSAAKLLLDYAERRTETTHVDLGEMTMGELKAMAEEMYDLIAAEEDGSKKTA